MTNEEAQNALANLKRYISGGGAVDRGTNNAIDMAIEALSKPEIVMCNDCISRQQAIEMCREPRMRNADCSDFEMEIMMLPSIHPKRGKWKNIVESIEYACGTCDTCGARVPMAYKYYEYCPRCGMKNEVKHDG